jgi:hypothetical protein
MPNYFLNLFRPYTTKPTSPEPKRIKVPGSGTTAPFPPPGKVPPVFPPPGKIPSVFPPPGKVPPYPVVTTGPDTTIINNITQNNPNNFFIISLLSKMTRILFTFVKSGY